MPVLLAPRARRTRRLAEAQRRIGFATSALAGARLSGALAMAVSASTVLRLMHGAPPPRATAPRVIGVDDWAWRKGRSWGSIIVDLERRRPIALLPDRSGAAFEAWLRRHHGVEVIARDRSRDYARAAQAAAPGAMQVTDRWHLLLNLRQMLERWLAGAHARLRGLPALEAGKLVPGRDHPFPRSHAEQAATLDAQVRQQMIHDEVRRCRAAGQSISAIAREVPLARGTVRRYATVLSALERGNRAAGPSILDAWLTHLERRLGEGCVRMASNSHASCALKAMRAALGRSINGSRRGAQGLRPPRRGARATMGAQHRRARSAPGRHDCPVPRRSPGS